MIFTEPSIRNNEHKMKLTEILFEKCNVPCMFIGKGSVFSAFSAGKSTCLVIDVGHSNTYSVPIHEGYLLNKNTIHQPFAGKYISQKLFDLVKS